MTKARLFEGWIMRGLVMHFALCCVTFFGLASLGVAGEKNKRTPDEIKATLREILQPKGKEIDEHAKALQRLKAYRYVAGVPYDDLVLDEDLNKLCLAGARLCAKLGKIEHKPKENPGLPEEEFELGVKGTSQSNLGHGFKTLAAAVDGWMDDSDSRNIDRLGHRRWCLNPTMKKTGFGRSDEFTAMYAFDRSRGNYDYDMICFPARGYMPVEFFRGSWAWNVTLNPKRFEMPDKDAIKPSIHRLGKDGEKMGQPLKLESVNVNKQPFGIPGCMIFRPDDFSMLAGRSYLVEIEGIMPRGANEPMTLRYVVEFISIK